MEETKKSKFFTGCLPDPEDKRDYDVSMAVEFDNEIELPREFKTWTPPLENQGSTGNCVAQSLAAIMECWYHSRFQEHNDMSVGYIYGNKREQSVKLTEGMIPREACASLLKYGDVFRSKFECLDEVPDVVEAFEKAYEELKDEACIPFSEYVSLNSITKLKCFIYTYKLPVLVTVDASEIYPMADGSHAIICYGWNWKNQLLCQNSWGDECSYPELPYKTLKNKWGLVPMAKEFTDVASESWYAQAVAEASEDNVLNGYPDGTFKPDKPITRAEMAAVYMRIKRMLFACGGEK